MDWQLEQVIARAPVPSRLFDSVDAIVNAVAAEHQPGDSVVVMSNGGFGGVHQKLMEALK